MPTRGIEAQITQVNGGTPNTKYPVYDGHGNMISQVSINQSYNAVSGLWSNSGVSLGNNRKYDAWGKVRGANSGGYPNNRYCANLGHVTDDELGLIYMRARYYEPSSGRFISQDPGLDGRNWYIYANNCPNENVDFTGLNWRRGTCAFFTFLNFWTLKGALFCMLAGETASAFMLLSASIASGAIAFALTDTGMTATAGLIDAILGFVGTVAGVIVGLAEGGKILMKSAYTAILGAVLITHSVTLLSLCAIALLEPFNGGFDDEWK